MTRPGIWLILLLLVCVAFNYISNGFGTGILLLMIGMLTGSSLRQSSNRSLILHIVSAAVIILITMFIFKKSIFLEKRSFHSIVEYFFYGMSGFCLGRFVRKTKIISFLIMFSITLGLQWIEPQYWGTALLDESWTNSKHLPGKEHDIYDSHPYTKLHGVYGKYFIEAGGCFDFDTEEWKLPTRNDTAQPVSLSNLTKDNLFVFESHRAGRIILSAYYIAKTNYGDLVFQKLFQHELALNQICPPILIPGRCISEIELHHHEIINEKELSVIFGFSGFPVQVGKIVIDIFTGEYKVTHFPIISGTGWDCKLFFAERKLFVISMTNKVRLWTELNLENSTQKMPIKMFPVSQNKFLKMVQASDKIHFIFSDRIRNPESYLIMTSDAVGNLPENETYYCRYDLKTGQFSEVKYLSSGWKFANFPDIAVEGDTVVVFWGGTKRDGYERQNYLASHDGGQTWSKPQVIAIPDYPVRRCGVSIKNNTIYLFFSQDDPPGLSYIKRQIDKN